MCLIVFAWQTHPHYPLILLANRDEFKQRPTTPLQPWGTVPEIYGGRDEVQGGTWLGITPRGRWAAVTNFRAPGEVPAPMSRGWLVRDFLLTETSPEDFIINLEIEQYAGFNLLLGTGQELFWFSNRGGAYQRLKPGLYGVSNHLLNTPWPKLVAARAGLQAELEKAEPDSQALLNLMQAREPFADAELPQTGVGVALERVLAPIFIAGEKYGTRSTTLLRWQQSGQIQLFERSYLPEGTSEVGLSFKLLN
jgi:uncharacterized protein with NRDE domain